MDAAQIEQALIFFGCLVVAVILHEISHGVVAYLFGDPTAKEAGRLTLNPVPHVDPFGSIVMPAIGAFTGIPVIGWAKPVPVNPRRLRNPRPQMLMVSLAGPATNFALALGAALVARGVFADAAWTTWSDVSLTARILLSFAIVNVGLGVFNLLPIPPLDGSAIIERFLPDRAMANYARFRPYGMAVLLLLVMFTPALDIVISPVLDRTVQFVVGA